MEMSTLHWKVMVQDKTFNLGWLIILDQNLGKAKQIEILPKKKTVYKMIISTIELFALHVYI